MRTHDPRTRMSIRRAMSFSTMGFTALGATLCLTASVASAQTPLEIEEAIDQAQNDANRTSGGTLRGDRSSDDFFGTTNASFGSGPASQEPETAGVPSEGYFFDSSEPRAFWRSQQGRRIVHPVTAPSYNDDAYVTSDLRASYINHQFPNALTQNGAARLVGVQFRKALNERWQVQIYKLGFNDVHIGRQENAGMEDLAVAVKYAFLQDWESQTHASIGLGYELGIGDKNTFANDDEVRIFGAFNKGFDRSHFGLSVNALFATGAESDNGDSDRLSAHLHYDYEVSDMFSPLVELNYYKTLNNGSPVTPFSGLDIANLGGNEDEDALSIGLGGELRFQRDLAVRLAYESPLTDNVDLWGYRWTASAIWRF